MSILDQIRHKCNEHSRRAVAEGRGFEVQFLTLLMEILEMNFGDLQSKANTLLDKLAQLEADTKALVAKSGGTAAQNPSTPADGSVVVSPDQLNSFAATLDNIGTRIDALKDEVVHGAARPAAPTPTSEPNPAPPSSPANTPPSSSQPTLTPGPGPVSSGTMEAPPPALGPNAT